MKIHWLSNAPWAQTGYGNQTALFAPRIKQLGHEISITGFYGVSGNILHWQGIPCYPVGNHPYGQDIANANAHHSDADILISLMDAWVCSADALQLRGMRWVPWFPVDSHPLEPLIAEQVSKAHARIVFSRHGERMVKEAGMDCYYIPHGVDTKAFYPTSQREARAALNIPDDVFLVGMVAANKGNPSRKAFQQHLEAFAAFKRTHKDAMLYLHTMKGEHNEGIHLPGLADALGLVEGKDVIYADQYRLMVGGYGASDMNQIYNALDVKMLVSLGEGFGIPLIEAQAAGCPVITGSWTAMDELCFSGWKVDITEAVPIWNPHEVYHFMPLAGAIVDRLEAAYAKQGNERMRKQARHGAMAYDADLVAERYWRPTLDDIAAKLDKAASVPGCKHEFIDVGIYNPDETLSAPCRLCGAEAIVENGRIIRINGNGFANPHGLKFTDPDGLEYILMREAEGYDIPLDPTCRVVDIGAHVGVVSMTLAKKYGCHVEAYEPAPDNYRRLVANIKANGLEDLITPHNLAVTADGRDVVISFDQHNSGGGNIYDVKKIYDAGVGFEVQSVKAADITAGREINLLKIDCEGAEFEILPAMNLSNVCAIRGEFHARQGDIDSLLAKVREFVPNTEVVMLR